MTSSGQAARQVSRNDGPAACIVGSGRWARLLCRIVLGELPEPSHVVMHAGRGAASLHDWIAAEALGKRVTVVTGPLFPGAAAVCPVLIANAAASHEESALAALERGCPTLVEKPLALSESGARRLIAAAEKSGAMLGVSNVFRFASYLDGFAGRVRDLAIRRIAVIWHDPAGEWRHGGRKNYDSALPVHADVLPHVVSILDLLLPGSAAAPGGLRIEDGGMRLELELDIGGKPCAVSLGRNQAERRRFLAVDTESGNYSIDFSVEPGRVTAGGREESGDSAWPTRPGPLVQQVRSFLSGTPDPRLSPDTSVSACRLADGFMPVYEEAQRKWIRAAIGRAAEKDAGGLVYAAVECAARVGTPVDPENRAKISDILRAI